MSNDKNLLEAQEVQDSDGPSPAELYLRSIIQGGKLMVKDIDPKVFHSLLDAGHNLFFKNVGAEGEGIDKIGQYSGTKTVFDLESDFPYTKNSDDGFKYIVIPIKQNPNLSFEEKTELAKTYIKEFDCLAEISKYEVVKSFVLSFDTKGMIDLLKNHYPHEQQSLNDALTYLANKLESEK